jgi:hypothetical protein
MPDEGAHAKQRPGMGIHPSINWEVADAAARAAIVGLDDSHVYRELIQQDDFSRWMVTSQTDGVPDWLQVHPGTSPWSVERGGTGNDLSGADDGSMFYFDTDRLLATDSAHLQWDNANKRLGIGLGATAFQSSRLEIVGGSSWPVIFLSVDPVEMPSATDAWISAEIFTTATTGARNVWFTTLSVRSASGDLHAATQRIDVDDYPDGVAAELICQTSQINHYAQRSLPIGIVFRAIINTWDTLGGESDITDGYYYYVHKDVNSGGIIDNLYVLYAPDITDIASNAWGLYTLGATKSFIGGQLLIGDATIGSATGRLVFKTGTTVADSGIEWGTDGANAPKLYRKGNTELVLETGASANYLDIKSTAGTIQQGIYNGGYFFQLLSGITNWQVMNAAANPLLYIASGGNVGIGQQASATSKLAITGLPTSDSGLSAGDVWNDGGVLSIV